jgi:ammonium transporter, Amt family
MALNGALAGLVSITADPLSPTPLLAIGDRHLLGGLLVVGSIVMLDRKFRIDDPVGAISVHGTAGIWGVLAVLLSNDEATCRPADRAGVIFSWVFLASLLVWFILKATVGIRVSEQEEYEGVDLHECGLEAYPEFTKAGD